MIMNDDYFLELQNNDMSAIPRTAAIYGGTPELQEAVCWELLRQFGALNWAQTEEVLVNAPGIMERAALVSEFTGVVRDVSADHPRVVEIAIHHTTLDNTNQTMFVCAGCNSTSRDHRAFKIVNVFDDLVVIEYGPTREKLYFVRRRKPESIFGVAFARATARTNDTDYLGTRRIGDVNYVYPKPCSEPHAAGQHERIGHPGSGSVNDLDYYIEPINTAEFSKHVHLSQSDMGSTFFNFDFDARDKD